MKRRSLLSFLGIIACLLLAVPVSGEDSWLDRGSVRDDGITVNVYLNIRTDNDKTMSVDLDDTRATNTISVKNAWKSAYLYYEVWNGSSWEKVIAYYYGTFDRACHRDDVYPYVCQHAANKGYTRGGVMAITKPAGDESTVGTIKVNNSVLSEYLATVQWGWNGLNTMYSQANGFTQHCLDYDTNSKSGAYDTNFYIDIDWKLPAHLAGKQVRIKFHKGQWYRDRSVNNTTDGDLVEFTRKVTKSDFWCLATPYGGTFSGIKKVTLTEMHVAGTKIYYTLDGSEPTTSSAEYKEPIVISQTTTLKYMPVCNDVKGDVQTVTYTINPIEYVDLGLPSGTIWATKNIGASKEEEYGDYFAWGEIEPKDTYTKDNYKWGNSGAFTKYRKDGRYRLEVQDDAASMNWGAQWRMPTKAQLTELQKNCTITWTKLNNVDGYLFTSKADASKSIFIPATGYKWVDNPTCLYLFSVDVQNISNGNVWRFRANDGSTSFGWAYTSYRMMGVPIRPVMDPKQPVTEYLWISGKADKTQYMVGDKFDVTGLEVNYLPKESSAEKVINDITWTVEPAVIHSGCKSVTVTASCKGLTTEPFKVAITNDGVPVDLGLSVQWSSFNLGSTSFMGEGDYYAWNKNMNNDIASVFGSGWRLPTEAEVKELQDTTKCTWEWFPAGNVENAGIAGYRVTGKSTGNFIFLPAIGCLSGSNVVGKGTTGNYWTSTTSGSNTCYMCFDAYDQCIGTDIPTNGRAIRAVKK